jgi:hypothetical protein
MQSGGGVPRRIPGARIEARHNGICPGCRAHARFGIALSRLRIPQPTAVGHHDFGHPALVKLQPGHAGSVGTPGEGLIQPQLLGKGPVWQSMQHVMLPSVPGQAHFAAGGYILHEQVVVSDQRHRRAVGRKHRSLILRLCRARQRAKDPYLQVEQVEPRATVGFTAGLQEQPPPIGRRFDRFHRHEAPVRGVDQFVGGHYLLLTAGGQIPQDDAGGGVGKDDPLPGSLQVPGAGLHEAACENAPLMDGLEGQPVLTAGRAFLGM